jgi:23S rRNA (cytidine1920-2'-O)/16S rRNA (cytidine1409-2'-O)-methyltransferase
MPPSPSRLRLDALLVERGLVASRERARALILAGQVLVDGKPGVKAGTAVPRQAALSLITPDHPYVGRGGLKLAHALDTFQLDVTGRTALDVGASTGGFTDVLLRRGATHVVALDVGHGQLDWRLRTDPRVTVLERVNARALTPETFGNGPRLFEIATIDVSFISLRLILPSVAPLLTGPADLVTLVKPQFEAGRDEVGKGGLVTDPIVQARVVDEVMRAAAMSGLETIAQTPSPIAGQEGNREFLLHLRRTDASSHAAAPPAAATPERGSGPTS